MWKRKITMKFKHLLPGLLVAYILLWCIFGVIYWKMACMSGGEFFLFQGDVLLKSEAVSFEKEAHVNVDYDLVKPLIQEYKDEYLLGMTDGKYPVLRYAMNENGYKNIGMDWMRYYYAQWSQEGYNFYKCQYIDDAITNPQGNKQVVKLTVCSIPENTYHKIAPSQYLTLPMEYTSKIVKSEEYYITLDKEMLKDFDYNIFYPLYENLYFISQSYNYLDDSILIIDKYTNQDAYNYSIMDFLYFSAVTITTLGYGDILPNSTEVRTVVMIETLAGMILIALIAAASYDSIRKRMTTDTP